MIVDKKQMETQFEILVVEDTPASLLILKHILTTNGYLVRTASCGLSALQLVEDKAPDLILLDVIMPDIDGFEVCRRLKADDNFKGIPVLFISAMGETSEKVRGFEAGGLDFITKPFNTLEVLARVKLHLTLNELTLRLEQKVEERTMQLMEVNLKLQEEIAERASAEQEKNMGAIALQESVALHRTILQTAMDGFWLVDMQGNILEVNEAYCRMSGFSTYELMSMTISDPEVVETNRDTEAYIRKITAILEDSFETIHRRKDGSLFNVEVRIQYKPANGGLIVVFIRDITLRKQAEEELKKSEEKFSKAFIICPEAMFITSLDDSKFIDVNDVFIKLTGFRKEEVIGSTLSELNLCVDDNQRKQLYEEILKNGFIKNKPIQYRMKTGKIFDFLISSEIIELEGRQCCLNFMPDVTERNIAEKEIRRLSQAVRQSPASVMITDAKGKIEYVNHKVLEITGYSLDELIGSNPSILKSGEMPDEVYRELWNTISSGREWRGDLHNKKKNGEDYWESALISPIFNDNGEITHYLSLEEDITERKDMIKELIVAKEKAELANNLKDAFIANISHEIRTPLNGILGMTALIHDTYAQQASEQDQRIFTSIKRSSKRLINTVEQILNYSRLQIGDFPNNIVPVSLAETLQLLVAKYNKYAFEKLLKINFISTTNNDDIVYIDSSALNTILENLIDNALKFTNEGSVNITLAKDNQSNLCIIIADTGIGISEEYQSHLFEPYLQEDTGYSRPYEGLGLGLPIVKKLIDLSGFSISVKSKKNEGTAFTICFDNQKIKQLENRTVPVERKIINTSKIIQGKKPDILIVEDDETNQFFVTAILKNEYNIAIADSVEKAVNLFAYKSFDLILMDISLKNGCNGLELTEIIRKGSINSDIPIIAVTGHAFASDRRKAFAAGCNDFLTKPFKSSQLLLKIKDFIG